ncbi:tyrosine-type recombinase/integrase [Microbulbifer sp. DLAB2-AA]|uniref:tyrosine-type recombinase/integrase n=1 Tax=Microbulbifer sp. DLAB2-AA TaxID=3243394 RepID=UPI004039C116
MALTDTQIKQAKPSDKDQWLTDQQGLRLLVKPNGSKYWRLKYRFKGRQKTLALGVYPSVSLKQARQKLAEAKQLLEEGRDPSVQKRVEKHQTRVNIDQSFAAVAEEWWNHQKGTWTEDHANRVWTRLRDNTFLRIGQRPIADLHPQDVIAIVRDIEERDAMDVAQRVLQDIRRVCRYAVQVGKLTHNPAIELTGILRGRKSNHRASLPREELPGFLKELDLYQKRGRILTKLAIQLLILTFVRPGELRCARWEEFDFESALWRIPGDRMKMGTDHIVPLSSQALAALEELKSLTGQYSLLFPSERERAKPMSDNTMRRAIFKMGWDGSQEGKSKANPHGFRATASSILNETGFNPDAIERQLSHMERNGVRAAYTHHARYMDERKEMMQWWANYLDEMRGSGKVVPIFAKQS